MKTTINWTIVSKTKDKFENLPEANVPFYFIDDDEYIKIGYTVYSNGSYPVYLAKAISPFDSVAGEPIQVLLTEIKSGFQWCYVSNVRHIQGTEHPEITTIKAARIYAGVSQRCAAERLGIPRRSLEDWERGARTPSSWVTKLIIQELIKIGDKEQEQTETKDDCEEE